MSGSIVATEAELACQVRTPVYSSCLRRICDTRLMLGCRTAGDSYDGSSRKGPRSRANTAHDYSERYNPVEEEPAAEPAKLTIPRLGSRPVSTPYDQTPERSPGRPTYSRSSTFEGPTRIQRDIS